MNRPTQYECVSNLYIFISSIIIVTHFTDHNQCHSLLIFFGADIKLWCIVSLTLDIIHHNEGDAVNYSLMNISLSAYQVANTPTMNLLQTNKKGSLQMPCCGDNLDNVTYFNWYWIDETECRSRPMPIFSTVEEHNALTTFIPKSNPGAAPATRLMDDIAGWWLL